MINREVRGISVNKIIALDIDEFRVGVVGYGYQDVRSSVYSEVKKNNLQYLLGKNNEPIYLKNKIGNEFFSRAARKKLLGDSTGCIVDDRKPTKHLGIR